ncbi:MAG: hypothetical protein Q9163_005523 [Psora crenata]
MLSATTPLPYHVAQNASLFLLSLFVLPISTSILLLSYLVRPYSYLRHVLHRHAVRCAPSFHPYTILVTGVGMTKGLVLARSFYIAGHNVIGADFEPYGVPVCGRLSAALGAFYRLPKPDPENGPAYYINKLLCIVRREKVDLWISCSGVASAVEDGQAMEVLTRFSDCTCIQFDASTTATLHEKHTFISAAQKVGLPTPETHNVTSRDAVHRVLHQSRRTKKRYIMKSIGVDDASRGDMTVLPKRTVSDTYNHVSRIRINKEKPWVLQQYIKGKEYCTHALIIQGKVNMFVACPSSDLLMHYEALPPASALSLAMLRFTEQFAARLHASGGGSGMTGHLSFDFIVDEIVSEKGAEMCLLPIECNPRAHTAVTLFTGQEAALTEAYLAALDKPETQMNGHANGEGLTQGNTVMPKNSSRYYWIGHDLVTLIIHPLLHLILRRITVDTFVNNSKTLCQHILLWSEGTYQLWDPLPFWWLYHVYWPGQFLGCIFGAHKWTRINVSTFMRVPNASAWQFHIDDYLQRIAPPNFTHTLPRPLSHFLGYREGPQGEIGNILVAFWACLGAFVAIILIEAVFMIPEVRHHGPPLLIASFGAVAVLQYNTIESPLAQPRNTVVGHLLATFTGIGITKLFTLNDDFEKLRWLAGGLSCGAASGIMALTETTYPPAGATALLAAVDPTVQHLGWYLLPLVLLSTAITFFTSLLLNNIQRRYPTYWWAPAGEIKRGKGDTDKIPSSAGSFSPAELRSYDQRIPPDTIIITPERIVAPSGILIASEEEAMLKILSNRLGERLMGLRTQPL